MATAIRLIVAITLLTVLIASLLARGVAIQSIVAWGIIFLSVCLAASFRQIGDRGGIIATGLALLGSILALCLVPQWAGALAAILFAMLIAVPMTLMVRANLASQRGQWTWAARLFRWAALLHPTPWARFTAAINANGPFGYAAALTEVEASGSRKQRALARLMLAYERRDWNDVTTLLRAGDAPFATAIPMEIRALGELGRLDEMVQAYRKAAKWLWPAARIGSTVSILAFTGRVERVKQVLEHRLLAATDEESRTYWMAVARLRRDIHDKAARSALRELSETGARYGQRRSAAWQLQQVSQDNPVPLSLSEDSARTVDDMGPDGELPPRGKRTRRGPWRDVLVLLLLAVIWWLLEIYLRR